jgi:hypothetical protein
MHVMKARTKKIASWANEDTPTDFVPPIAAGNALTRIDQRVAIPDTFSGDSEKDAPIAQDISDRDWMRKRMTTELDPATEDDEKMFSQPEDEDAIQEVTKVRHLLNV